MFKEYRLLRKYTQEEMAELLEKDVRTIQRIENGESKPSLETFKKIIKILKISDKDIINYLKQ